jgi:pyrimidine-nucleoside phosphorylase
MVDLILAKRAGKAHSRAEIDFIIKGVTDDSIKDYQLAAWLMAVCWQGMTLEETADLTDAMAKSGQVLDLSSIGPVVGDKHSTGGVGDKTTIVFAPLLAAAGIPMAKLSGRGLGFTGGTIDKLEAIPGFSCELSTDRFIEQVRKIGAAIGGQTQDLAPADGRIYAMRDVTGTVESVPLICASVVSKKIAAGANLIILDVKCGRGAFMDTDEKATDLAKIMSRVGDILKRPVTAVVTDMDQPLGYAVGHTLEVIEAVETLKGNGPPDLTELCMSLGSHAMVRAGKAKTDDEARKVLEELISSGKALSKLREIITAQGGNPAAVDDYSIMPQAKYKYDVPVPGEGTRWVRDLDGRQVAHACKVMGAGRTHKGDPINLAVGIVLHAKVGDEVQAGKPVATIYADSEGDYKAALEKFNNAIIYSDKPVPKPPVIRARVG